MSKDYDVVVVGGGSAGCALVSHLCGTTDVSVCLVEAGPDYGPLQRGGWPELLLDPRRQPITHDWGYEEERADGTLVPESRAKVIGGCSTHNQCAAVWPSPQDFDRWALAGNPEWRSTELAPFIKQVDAVLVPSPYREDELAAWQRIFLETAVRAGYPRVEDLSDPRPDEAVAPFPANVRRSIRWNSAFAFLDGVRERRTLTVLDRTNADRLILDGHTVGGLHCLREGETFTLGAAIFVLCAGTYGSATILMRSGVGPEETLAGVGIPLLHHLRGVGRNLHDHYGVWMDYEGTPEFLRQARHGPRYESQVILRARSSLAEDGFDLHILPYEPTGGAGTVSIGAMCLTPRSRGYVQIGSADALEAPRINFRFLSDPSGRDVAVIRDGMSIIEGLIETLPLANMVVGGSGLSRQHPESSAESIWEHLGGYSHPVGTCRMGPAADPMAVVDGHGQVHGFENVFVADASIIPEIPRANTNLACMLIGLRIAACVASITA